MKISSLPEGDICDVSFGYNPKMYEYTTLMSDIPKLYAIDLEALRENYLYSNKLIL